MPGAPGGRCSHCTRFRSGSWFTPRGVLRRDRKQPGTQTITMMMATSVPNSRGVVPSLDAGLEDIYTPAERTLLDAGETDAVKQTRLAFQRAMKTRFTDVVEQATGRKVRAFLSQTHINPDISCEIFVLQPCSSH